MNISFCDESVNISFCDESVNISFCDESVNISFCDESAGFLSGFGPRGGKTAICNLVGGHGSLNMHST